jgi:hypothetical protein
VGVAGGEAAQSVYVMQTSSPFGMSHVAMNRNTGITCGRAVSA